MPLVDKIEYIGNRGHLLKLYNNGKEYSSVATHITSLTASAVFSMETQTYNADLIATKCYGSSYAVNKILNIGEDYDWLASTNSNAKEIVTVSFEQSIPIDKISVKPNLNNSQYKTNTATINVYNNETLITTKEYTRDKDTDIVEANIIMPYTYLLKSENNYYTIANGQLTQVVDTSAGGMTDLSLITPALLQGITQPKLVVISEDEIPSGVSISAKVKLPPQTIIQKTDVDIQTAEELSNIIITHSGTAIVKISCSIDSGMSWVKYDGNTWVPTELSDGMDIDTIQGLTSEQLDYLVQGNKLRFGIYIEPQSIDDNIVLQNIKFSMKKEGLWTSCILNTDYTYGRGTDFIEFTAKKAGDYLINYTK